MFGRIFGRSKDEPEAAVCAKCGRTLLAGEWTRRVTDAGGEERLICSLCGPDLPLDQDEPPDVTWTPANNGRVRETREDARASDDTGELARVEAEPPRSELEGKNAEIASLLERLARAERQNQELRSELERIGSMAPASVAEGGPAEEAAAMVEAEAAPVVSSSYEQFVDSSEPGELTWGETPAEFAAELADRLSESEVQESAPGQIEDVPSVAFEDTQPMPAVSLADEDEPAAAVEPQGGEPEAVEQPRALEEQLTADEEAPEEADVAAQEEYPPEGDSMGEADVAALALLQRGVDLFNVGRVPRKIAETNEQLGTPSVHAEPRESGVTIMFMWSMGWYRFQVDTESGDVALADRGYEEITDLSSNAAVRADGTVHLAPAQISRAAAQRLQQEETPDDGRASERVPDEPEPPSVAAQKPPEILSKSLLGQRSDDKPAVWEKTKARDFDWDH